MLSEILEKYLDLFPQDRSKLKVLIEQVKNNDHLSGRENYIGHVTGSAIILSPDYQKMLLIYHPHMERWQQSGGHWDEDESGPWDTSEREAEEETGVKIARMLALPDRRVPIQIDSHLIPSKPPKNEPEHYHHDFRYLFVAASEDLILKDEVIKEAKWQKLEDLDDRALEEVIQRAQQLKLLKA